MIRARRAFTEAFGAQNVAFGLLAGLVLLAPLPFGAVSFSAAALVTGVAAAVGLASAWMLARGEIRLTRRAIAVLAAASVVLLVGLVQLAPLPSAWPAGRLLGVDLGQVSREVGVPAPLGVSPSPTATLDASARYAALLFVGLGAAAVTRTERHLRAWGFVIIASGCFQALYGAAEYLSGRQHIFGYAKVAYLDSATGTFINRNHYASFLAMCLPLAMSLLLGRWTGARASGWRERVLQITSARGLERAALGAAVCALWLGILLSRSRAGLAVALLGTAVVLWRPRRSRLLPALVIVALLLVPVFFLLLETVDPPGARLAELRDDIHARGGRLVVWSAATELLQARPLLGFGLGTFDDVFPVVQPAEVVSRYRHAHNEWLQAATEGGLVSVAAIAVAFGLLVTRTRPPSHGSELAAAMDRALTASILVVAAHSLVDFPLRIPAVAALLGVMVGLLSVLPLVAPPSRTAPAILTHRPRSRPAAAGPAARSAPSPLLTRATATPRGSR